MSLNFWLQVVADTFLVSVHGVHLQDMLDDQLGQHGILHPQGGEPLPESNSVCSPVKMDGWNTIRFLLGQKAYFQGLCYS